MMNRARFDKAPANYQKLGKKNKTLCTKGSFLLDYNKKLWGADIEVKL